MYPTITLIILFLISCQQSIVKRANSFLDYEKLLSEKDYSYKEYSKKLEMKYHKLFSNKKVDFSKCNNELLKDLFTINSIMSFYTIKDEYLSNVEKIFKEIEKRNLEKEKLFEKTYIEQVFGLYIKFGYFSKAKELQKKYPDILTEYIPEVIEDPSVVKDKYKIYEVLDDGKILKLTSIQIEKGTKIIIFVDPYCEFAKKALSLILFDENLRKYFEENGLLIFPINTSISEISSISEWNKKNKLKWFVHSSRNDLSKDWENFDITQSPNFYFLKDGKITFQINGFVLSEEEFKLELYKAIDKINPK
jgi:hypothetical protein